MLKPALLYAQQLKEKHIGTWFDDRYMYYRGCSGDFDISLHDNNIDTHEFVSVDKNDNVIGYISYHVDWCAMNTDNIGIISYDLGNVEFVKDCFKAICDLFEKYHMNRIGFFVYADNPARRGYENFIKKHGGRACAYFHQIRRLSDGRLHDGIEFEILKEEFHR